jgi:hypothetical protein
MTILNNSVECDLWKITNLSNDMNMDSFNIFSIVMSDTFECRVTEVEESSNVKYVEMGIKYFMENYLDNPNIDFWKYNKNSLYILRGGDYYDVKEMFTMIHDTKVRIVRGSSQKSHMVSPIDFRLSSYLLILCNMNFKKFNTENSFNMVSKNRYLPSLG